MTVDMKSSRKEKEDVHELLNDGVYAAHLAEVNETRDVVASEDIMNARGVLLVKKGAPITPKVTRAIIEFKLTKPLQDSISIANEVGAGDLLKCFMKVLEQDMTLRMIHERYQLHSLLEQQCKHYDTFPLLRQKITVMSDRLPDIYQRTLYSAWLGLLIAKEMRLPPPEIANVFLAALSHDIGMLHISQDILNKKGKLSAEEWRQIQAHVVIGQKILVAIKEVPLPVSIAVLEHHERCDGTGYPLGKMENELSLAGQIIALTDSVVAIYINRFKPEGRGWRELIPVLQMNSQAFFYRNYEVLVTILRRSNLPSAQVVSGDTMPRFIMDVIQANRSLKIAFDEVNKTMRSLGFTHGDRKLHALQNVLIHIATAVNGSGILEDSFVAWLEQVRNQRMTGAYSDVENVFLMQEEVSFHLQRLSRMMQIYLDTHPAAPANIRDLLGSCLLMAGMGIDLAV